VVGLLAACLWIPLGVSAQQLGTASLRSALEAGARGSVWRISTLQGRLIEGPLGMPTTTTLRVGAGSDIPLDSVNAAWERGRATKVGAVVGGLLVGVGSAIGVGYDCATEGAEVDCHVIGSTLVGGILGATVGGAVGAVIGTAIPRWHQRYP
jgi:hypothetical protein